jgi:hypothetical protein
VVNKPYRKYCDLCWKIFCRTMRTTPRRVDANHLEIVNALRAVGCGVLDLSAVGKGAPDILVAHPNNHDRMCLMEIKSKAGKVNPLQQKWHSLWPGGVRVVRTVDEALAAILQGGHHEVRVRGDGSVLGPKAFDPRSYDERQIGSK